MSGLRKGSVPQILRNSAFIYVENYHFAGGGGRGRPRRTAEHRPYVRAGTDVLQALLPTNVTYSLFLRLLLTV